MNYRNQAEHNYSYILDKTFARRDGFYQKFELRNGDCYADMFGDCKNDEESWVLIRVKKLRSKVFWL